MLIGEVMERTPPVQASENMANRLADKIRNIWLENTNAGYDQWEENFFEDPDGIRFLAEESFPRLQGIDYIFRWWGAADPDELAGDLEVLWKVRMDGEMAIYKTTIRFAGRDFPGGEKKGETLRREKMREEFRKAFSIWQKLYQNI